MDTRDVESGLSIRGLCPKCGDWFPCDDWFDFSVPTPCCPGCHITPARIECTTPTGVMVIGVDAGSELWIG